MQSGQRESSALKQKGQATMKKFRKPLPLLIGFGILGVGLVLLNNNQVRARNRNGALPITVENTAPAPSLVRDVDNVRTPFQATCSPSFPDSGTIQCLLVTVGNGTRLVIETISGFLSLAPGSDPGKPFLQTTVNGVAAKHYLRSSLDTHNGRDTWTFTEYVRIYADPTTLVLAHADTGSTGNVGDATFTISGYIVPSS